MHRSPDYYAAVIKHQPKPRNITMKNLLDLFRFKKPLLARTAVRPELVEGNPVRPELVEGNPVRPELVEGYEQQARHALIKLGNRALQKIQEIDDTESPEYERQMDLLTGYIRLKQQLDNLLEDRQEQSYV